MNSSAAVKDRAFYHQMVLDSTPGRFQGEPDWTAYFYEHMLNGEGAPSEGEGEGEPNDSVWFVVAGSVGGLADIALFPELEGAVGVVLRMDDDGFVSTEVIW